MIDVVHMSVPSAPPLIHMDLLRRKLKGELIIVREKIVASGCRDEMTEKIENWRKKFIAALNTSADAQDVCSTYIGLLQEMLCDPITNAPLDAYAVIGNDGHTYGQMSLAVYLHSMPEMLRNRSPLDPSNPFMIAPHPIARHMVRWLEQHDSLLYSEELERAYLQLLPSQQPIDRAERMNRIMARQAALDQLEAERKRSQFKEFDKKLEGRMQAWGLEIERLVSFTSCAGDDLARLAERDERAHHAAKKRLDSIALKEQAKYKSAEEALDRIEEQQPAVLEAIQQQLDLSTEEERNSIARLKEKIIDHVENVFSPLTERIKVYVNEMLAKIQTVTLKEQQALQIFDHSIRQMEREIADLEQQNQLLEENIENTSRQIIAAKQEEVLLQRGIYDTQVAIQEMKERKKESLLATIAVVGASVFTCWALQAMLQSTSIGAAILPERGGAILRIKITL